MTLPSLILGSPQWFGVAAILTGIAFGLVAWTYSRSRAKRSVRLLCATLKLIGFAALAMVLLEPLLTGTRPKPGANAFAVLADNSQSMLIHDGNGERSRSEWVRERLVQQSPWATRLAQDFDVRNYVFDSHLRSVDRFDGLRFDGTGSAIGVSLAALSKRFRGLPLAGILLFTDGNRTDLNDIDIDWSAMPPVYPVVPPSRGVTRDVGLKSVSVTQTSFESAPVVLRADATSTGFAGEPIVATLIGEDGKLLERQEAASTSVGKPLSFRFQFRPDRKGVNFYQVHVVPRSEEAKEGVEPKSTEQTLENNNRLVVVDQGGGPYRILYVGGRPNWEFKYLRRALADDEQTELVGLLRIARRQPKFDFQASGNRKISPLFDGFDRGDTETADEPDKPVLVRLGTLDEVELRDGFPKAAADLYRYHAIIIDDIESHFFSPDQLALLRNFVSVRGGGFLMLGGPDTFADGHYDRTPVGDLLPVYLHGNGNDEAPAPVLEDYRLLLTREGWLQPWVRLRKTEEDEQKRLSTMPPFQTLSRVGGIKPGAVTLAEIGNSEGGSTPALVAQTFGKGHVAALLIGDFWRWGLRRAEPAESDLERAWRQTTRWLVSDVPERIEVVVRTLDEAAGQGVALTVRVRDAEYRPLDNAKVALKLTIPGGETLTLDAPPDNHESGVYSATYVPKKSGPYRVVASVTAPEGSTLGEREAGWAAQPAADEFSRLEPDRAFLETIAEKTKGEVVDGDRLLAFTSHLSTRAAPITEPWTTPIWHHPLYFSIALACLAAEWGLRRVNGLA